MKDGLYGSVPEVPSDNFADVKGQEHIVTTLANQLKSDRVGHAYLFCGTRGTGKTSVAKILARAVNCQNPTEGGPCNQCETCREILSGASLNVIEIDAASNNGVDNIREIREEVAYRPAKGRYKVYIIDEVHMLSAGAFNALLKTLEEPPSYVIFILATTEAHKIPVTILSRCQRYDFRRISMDTIAGRLSQLLEAEGGQAEEKAIQYIAKAADGSMRDALSLLERCIAFYMGEMLTYDKVMDVLGAVDTEIFSRLLRRVVDGDVAACIRILEEMVCQGKELGQFVNDFIWYMRNLLLVMTSDQGEEIVDLSSQTLSLLEEERKMLSAEVLMRYIRVFSELSNRIRYETQKRVLVEIALIKLCRPAMETNLDSVLDRIRVLEKQMEEGVFASRVASPSEASSANPVSEPEKMEKIQETPRPQKAAPEDLQKVVEKGNWSAIIGETSGRFKEMLVRSIPKYSAADGQESVLYVEFQNYLAESYVNDPERKQELEALITEKIGKSVQVEMLMKNSHTHGDLAELSVDDIIKEEIHMNVEIED